MFAVFAYFSVFAASAVFVVFIMFALVGRRAEFLSGEVFIRRKKEYLRWIDQQKKKKRRIALQFMITSF